MSTNSQVISSTIRSTISLKFHQVTSKVFSPQLSLLFLLTSNHIHHYPDQGLAQIAFYPSINSWAISRALLYQLSRPTNTIRSNFFTITLLKGAQHGVDQHGEVQESFAQPQRHLCHRHHNLHRTSINGNRGVYIVNQDNIPFIRNPKRLEKFFELTLLL